tara:strand:+ start:2125 stop:2532 length:408 start_codon:yes stop_codon:yes gene_type:complete
MFKDIFLTGLLSGVLAIIACLVYSTGYFSYLGDFSEEVTVVKIIAYCLIASMLACIIYMVLSKIISNPKFADFTFNILFALVSLVMVFLVIDMADPVFENEMGDIFKKDYKGFLMPMLFFPVLGWMIAKPLFHKS